MTNDTGGSDNNGTGNAQQNEGEQTTGENAGKRVSRRDVLRTSTTAAIGATGVSAMSGNAAATSGEDDIELGVFECTESSFQINHFDTVDLNPWWWHGDYNENFDINDLSDEIAVYFHGFLANEFTEEQATHFENSIKHSNTSETFDGDVITVEWPGTGVTYTGPWDRAEEYGRKFADWLMDVLWAQTDTTVNVVGHSLGGRASLNMLNRLNERNYNGDNVKNVVTVGLADMQRYLCDHNETGDRIYNYYDGINEVPDNVYVLHSSDDFAVGTMHELWGDALWYTPDGEGAGAHGVMCDNHPDNLVNVDVSDEVDNHCEYFKPDGDPETLTKAVNGQL